MGATKYVAAHDVGINTAGEREESKQAGQGEKARLQQKLQPNPQGALKWSQPSGAGPARWKGRPSYSVFASSQRQAVWVGSSPSPGRVPGMNPDASRELGNACLSPAGKLWAEQHSIRLSK